MALGVWAEASRGFIGIQAFYRLAEHWGGLARLELDNWTLRVWGTTIRAGVDSRELGNWASPVGRFDLDMSFSTHSISHSPPHGLGRGQFTPRG